MVLGGEGWRARQQDHRQPRHEHEHQDDVADRAPQVEGVENILFDDIMWNNSLII